VLKGRDTLKFVFFIFFQGFGSGSALLETLDADPDPHFKGGSGYITSDTCDKFMTGVVDTGKKLIRGVVDSADKSLHEYLHLYSKKCQTPPTT